MGCSPSTLDTGPTCPYTLPSVLTLGMMGGAGGGGSSCSSVPLKHTGHDVTEDEEDGGREDSSRDRDRTTTAAAAAAAAEEEGRARRREAAADAISPRGVWCEVAGSVAAPTDGLGKSLTSLLLPGNTFDLDGIHPPDPPYLGTRGGGGRAPGASTRGEVPASAAAAEVRRFRTDLPSLFESTPDESQSAAPTPTTRRRDLGGGGGVHYDDEPPELMQTPSQESDEDALPLHGGDGRRERGGNLSSRHCAVRDLNGALHGRTAGTKMDGDDDAAATPLSPRRLFDAGNAGEGADTISDSLLPLPNETPPRRPAPTLVDDYHPATPEFRGCGGVAVVGRPFFAKGMTNNGDGDNDDGEDGILIRNGVLIRGAPPTPPESPASPSSPSYSVGSFGVSSSRSSDEEERRRLQFPTPQRWQRKHRSSPSDKKSKTKRRTSTLPSTVPNRPIRLRVTETHDDPLLLSPTDGGDPDISFDSANAADHYSFNPVFSAGQYAVTTPSGTSWGNGLVVKMLTADRMQMQDGEGNVIAVTRSRHTFTPSHIIYGARPRFEGQVPSSHRPSSTAAAAASCGGENPGSAASSTAAVGGDNVVDLYPWALVRKEGRQIDDAVTVHMVESRNNSGGGEAGGATTSTTEGGGNNISGGVIPAVWGGGGITAFSSRPTYRSRHGFDGHGDHSHTVVCRVEVAPPSRGGGPTPPLDGTDCGAAGGGGSGIMTEEKEFPCCLILRDPTQRGVYHLTVAPGIDPLLVVCYLSVHAKMDIEPVLPHH